MPKWKKPSDTAALERTAQYASEGLGRAAHPPLPVPAPSARQKIKVLDADDGKRGSTASQYDNVPGTENEAGAAVEGALERAYSQSPRDAGYPSSPRKHAEASPGPSKVASRFTFAAPPPGHARCPSQLEVEERGPVLPPSYSNPPVYHRSSPEHAPAAQSPGAQGNPSRRPYGSALSVGFSPEKAYGRPAPIVLPSSRIEVLPAETGAGGYSDNAGSPKNGKLIIPPVDYLPDHRKWSEVSYRYKPEMHGPSWPPDASRGHVSGFPKYPAFQHVPFQAHDLPAVSVDSPVRYRTSPAVEAASPSRYQYSGPSPPAYHYRNRDGLSVQESVLL